MTTRPDSLRACAKHAFRNSHCHYSRCGTVLLHASFVPHGFLWFAVHSSHDPSVVSATATPVLYGISERCLVFGNNKKLLTDFLGRLQPSKNTTQKTRGTQGVEESSSPRRVLHFHSSNASKGRIRAELWGFKVISKGYPCDLVFRNQLSFSPEGPDLGFKGRSLVTQMNSVSGTQGETMPERGLRSSIEDILTPCPSCRLIHRPLHLSGAW